MGGGGGADGGSKSLGSSWVSPEHPPRLTPSPASTPRELECVAEAGHTLLKSTPGCSDMSPRPSPHEKRETWRKASLFKTEGWGRDHLSAFTNAFKHRDLGISQERGSRSRGVATPPSMSLLLRRNWAREAGVFQRQLVVTFRNMMLNFPLGTAGRGHS